MPGDMLWCHYLVLLWRMMMVMKPQSILLFLVWEGALNQRNDIIVDVKLLIDDRTNTRSHGNLLDKKQNNIVTILVVSKREQIVYGLDLVMIIDTQAKVVLGEKNKKKLLKSLPPVVPITTIKKWTRQG